jgi:hypothetical protein
LFLVTPAAAQTTTATLTGVVVDASGAVVPGASVTVVNSGTQQRRNAVSGPDGSYIFASLPPGRYVLLGSLDGFKPVEMRDIVLNVDDRIAIKVVLAPAGIGEEVNVVAETSHVRTAPAVSTVIDRQFVENLPLNGRSLQSLLELTPGVSLTRVTDSSNQGGQFSVNGQRTNANYFTVDGVSANIGISGGSGSFPGQSGSGQLPGLTALGGTNSLVSVDALQEFRIHTSSYAPEFGRTPGGQVSMVTRSGTNSFSGSLFEYFRDDKLDANDYFAKRNNLPKPKLSQHNFGGVLGGPLFRNRTFFFFSYEGLRLDQPNALVVTVPNMETRRTASPAVRPLLDGYPIPNGRDLGGGLAEFAASFSDPSDLDATSLRVDHNWRGKVTLFGRYTDSPSVRTSRTGALSHTNSTHTKQRGFTAGSTWLISPRLVNDVRFNWSRNAAPFIQQLDTFGGAVVPAAESIFQPGRNPDNAIYLMNVVGAAGWAWGTGTDFLQRQLNIVDSLTMTTRSHEFKVGLDYRRVYPVLSGGNTGFQNLSFTVAGLPTGTLNFYQKFARTTGYRSVAFDNISAFFQDNWRPSARLTLTYGLRWEYVPPPHALSGPEAITLENLEDPYGGQVHLAPANTPLWKKRHNNLGPRVGGSYQLSDAPGRELIVKAGYGIFHDIGLAHAATTYRTYPFAASATVTAPTYPLSEDVLRLPRLVEDPPQQIWIFDRNLKLPYTHQWNLSVERSLGTRQIVTVGYIGAKGKRLIKLDRYSIPLLEWPAVRTPVNVARNNGYSDYHALQLQFNRRLHQGLQALASYTYGKSQDTASADIAINIPAEKLPSSADYGESDFDVRHVFTAAVTYNLPIRNGGSVPRLLLRDWGVDVMFRARSAFPIPITTTVPFPPDNQTARPNVVPGQPFWIDDPTVPGGTRLNRAAFSQPNPDTQGDLRRGAVRGYGAWQIDLAFRRDFPLPGKPRLQFRGELFNLTNHVILSDPSGSLAAANFGVATQMLGRGFGGLNALYQIGGPRSAQLALKLLF